MAQLHCIFWRRRRPVAAPGKMHDADTRIASADCTESVRSGMSVANVPCLPRCFKRFADRVFVKIEMRGECRAVRGKFRAARAAGPRVTRRRRRRAVRSAQPVRKEDAGGSASPSAWSLPNRVRANARSSSPNTATTPAIPGSAAANARNGCATRWPPARHCRTWKSRPESGPPPYSATVWRTARSQRAINSSARSRASVGRKRRSACQSAAISARSRQTPTPSPAR